MDMKTLNSKLTNASRTLFKNLAVDAGDWSGTPIFEGTAKDKGNLTHLKKLGLVTTDLDEGDLWVTFTKLGNDLAESLIGYRPDSGYKGDIIESL